MAPFLSHTKIRSRRNSRWAPARSPNSQHAYLASFIYFNHVFSAFFGGGGSVAALGLCCCCVQAFSSCGEQGYSLVAGGFHCGEASPTAEHRLCGPWNSVASCGLSSCGPRALDHRLTARDAMAFKCSGMCNPPGSGGSNPAPCIGRIFTTEPPGKSHLDLLCNTQDYKYLLLICLHL